MKELIKELPNNRGSNDECDHELLYLKLAFKMKFNFEYKFKPKI